MEQQSHIYRYRVDPADLLVWVDRWWLAFARENGAPELANESILGSSLWDFVSGDVTRKLFSELHARVRSSGKRVVLPFRCDSPTLQRHMRLTITREEAGQLLYESVLLRVVPQRRLAMLDTEQRRSDCLLTICSCCKRGLLESAGWLELEDVSVRLQLFDSPRMPELRYTVCPECANQMNNSSGTGIIAPGS